MITIEMLKKMLEWKSPQCAWCKKSSIRCVKVLNPYDRVSPYLEVAACEEHSNLNPMQRLIDSFPKTIELAKERFPEWFV